MGKLQGELFPRRGGKRPGAGRPAKGKRPSERHERRPAHVARHPVHVTLRVAQGVGSLRRRHVYQAIREATLVAARDDRFRIVQISIQTNHIHLIIEAESRGALIRGVWGFQISAARHVNRVVRRKGTVFPDRYHAAALTTPRHVRNVLAYVLNNWRHHQPRVTGKIDPYASSWFFEGWREQAHERWFAKPPRGYEPLVTWRARTWLMKTGWVRHGLISMTEVPGERGS